MSQDASIFLVGLGNPGSEYVGTRHNLARDLLDYFRRHFKLPDWQSDAKRLALVSTGKIGSRVVTLICPETMMNRSGDSVAKFVTSKATLGRLVVLNDDLDLSLGTFKLSFNSGAGGHRGVESIIKQLNSKSFVRVRMGIVPSIHSGKLKKPKGGKAVIDFILGHFKPKEVDTVKRLKPKVRDAMEEIILHGYEAAMNDFN